METTENSIYLPSRNERNWDEPVNSNFEQLDDLISAQENVVHKTGQETITGEKTFASIKASSVTISGTRIYDDKGLVVSYIDPDDTSRQTSFEVSDNFYISGNIGTSERAVPEAYIGTLHGIADFAVSDNLGNPITGTYARKDELPRNVSELTNDVGYLTYVEPYDESWIRAHVSDINVHVSPEEKALWNSAAGTAQIFPKEDIRELMGL